MQLWHVGRISPSAVAAQRRRPGAPSAIQGPRSRLLRRATPDWHAAPRERTAHAPPRWKPAKSHGVIEVLTAAATAQRDGSRF